MRFCKALYIYIYIYLTETLSNSEAGSPKYFELYVYKQSRGALSTESHTNNQNQNK